MFHRRFSLADSSQLAEVSKPWHEELANFMIQNPGATQAAIAKHFGKSVSWISIVKNSDAFQDYYNARRSEVNALADATLVDKLEGLAEMGVEALIGKLEDHFTGDTPLSLDALKEVSDMALGKLGFGAKMNGGGLNTGDNTTVVIADMNALEAARRRLAEMRTATEVPSSPTDITPENNEEQTREAGQSPQAVSPPE